MSQIIKRVISENKLSKKDIRGIALSGHGPSAVFVDSDGNALSKIITWQDKRAREEASYLKEHFKEFERDGTSYEAKVLWFYRKQPDLFKENNKILYPKDYVVYKLTGSAVIDRSAASTTLFYDLKLNNWKQSVVGIPLEVLPRIVDSWELVGETSGRFSRECGLGDGVPVFAGGIDAYCEAIGAGAINSGDIVDGSGTSTCISVCGGKGERNDIHVIPNRTLDIRMMSATGLSINWILNLFSESIGYIRKMVFNTPVKLIFLPYLNGERSPYWDEKARGTFIGLTSNFGKDEIIGAVLQGIAFGVRQNLLSLGAFYGGENVNAVGGGSENELWVKLKADVTGKIYNKMAISNASALGALILAAFGSKEGRLEELVGRWVRVDKTFYPEKNPLYDKLFSVYTECYPSLKDVFNKLYMI